MKKKLTRLLLLGLLNLCLLFPKSGYAQDDLVSLNFYQTDTHIILQALADFKQLNLVMVDPVQNVQTINLKKIPWSTALDIVLKLARLEAEIRNNVLYIQAEPDKQTLQQQEDKLKLEWLYQKPLLFLPIALNHSDPQQMMTMIQQQGLLSERGKVFIDSRSGMLMVQDIKEQFATIESLIETFDQPASQIHIAAHIVTMSSESLTQLGVRWGYTGHSSQLVNQATIGMPVTNPTTSVGFTLAKLTGGLLNLELSALEAENQVQIVASPNLLTSNQHPASIKQGTEIPYEVSSGNNSNTTIEFKQAVLGLEVTPRVLSNGRLELNLQISQNTVGQSIKRSDGGEALAIDTQEIKTQVIVSHGETLVLGGIFQQLNKLDNSQVPGLSQVPLIGNLFKYQGKQQQRRELVIFITPQIIQSLK